MATVDEALMSGEKVKVITENNESYIFRRLHREDESLYGITRQGSSSAKKLNGEKDGKMLKVPLLEDNIEEIHLKDDTKSTSDYCSSGCNFRGCYNLYYRVS